MSRRCHPTIRRFWSEASPRGFFRSKALIGCEGVCVPFRGLAAGPWFIPAPSPASAAKTKKRWMDESLRQITPVVILKHPSLEKEIFRTYAVKCTQGVTFDHSQMHSNDNCCPNLLGQSCPSRMWKNVIIRWKQTVRCISKALADSDLWDMARKHLLQLFFCHHWGERTNCPRQPRKTDQSCQTSSKIPVNEVQTTNLTQLCGSSLNCINLALTQSH